MYFAKNNILVALEPNKAQNYAIMNPLSGNFDLLDQTEYEQISTGSPEVLKGELADYMMERGYLFTSKTEEDRLVQKKWRDFQGETADTQTQLLLIPSYGCNIACTYCYQAGVEAERGLISPEAVDAFFNYAETTFGNHRKKPFITLFGGEPLINTPRHRAIINYIIDNCVKYDYEVAAVTNGYHLLDYIDILSRAKVKEIQVTMDGSQEMHDQRRIFANGKGTFEQIVLGIEAAVKRKIPINLRSVIDRENLGDMVAFAEFLDNKGWLDLPSELFKTQIGRNYELFDCYAKPQHLMAEAELWREFSKLSRKHPILRKFHRPNFKGIRQLVDTGEMYMASFDTCPAAKTEWVFDLHGDIYGCTASCGREEYKLGTFYPEVRLNQDDIGQWQNRNVNNISECRDCKYNVICGGGCGVVAANKTGRVLAPDCRPIQDLMEIGINHYSQEILEMAEQGAKACCSKPQTELQIPTANAGCNCSADQPATENVKHNSGCMLCGEPLVYDKIVRPVECVYCGVKEDSVVSCANHHYVCDKCHSQGILTPVESLCVDSDDKDPMTLLNKVFAITGLNMHGPEYHSIVPAVITAAYANITGTDKTALVHEAVIRGRDIKGGSCGLHGVCGAAAGAGIAYSLIHQVSPLSKEERGNTMKVTATVLTEMSGYGGPRCCKRESSVAVETAVDFFPEFKAYVKDSYVCTQFKENKDCIKKECAYFPRKFEQREELIS